MEISESSALPSAALKVFESLPYCCLVLSPQLNILTASDAYLEKTGKLREDITGSYLFDAFPIEPDWASESNDGGIAASLEQVLQTRQPHTIPLTRFDIPDVQNPDSLKESYWITSHKPVLNDNGEISYIIHDTRDVSEKIIRQMQLEQSLETEKKATAKAENLSKQMELLFHSVPAQIAVVTGPELVFTYINPEYKNELVPNRNVLGLPLLAAMPEIAGEPIWHILNKVYNTGEAFIETEIHVPLAEETGGRLNDHYFNVVYQPLKDESGNMESILSFKYEVTEHVAARKLLEMNEQELLQLNHQLSEAYQELQASNEEMMASNEELVATNEELNRTQGQLAMLNEDLEEKVRFRTAELLESESEQQALNEELTAINEELAATNEDLLTSQTSLKNTIANLEISEQKVLSLVESAPFPIGVYVGKEMRIELVNQAIIDVWGKGADIVGKTYSQVLPELKGSGIYEQLDNVFTTGKAFHVREQRVDLVVDGRLQPFFFNYSFTPLYDSNGNVYGVMNTAADITDLIIAKQQVEQSEKTLHSMILQAPVAMCILLGPKQVITVANSAMVEIWGKPKDNIINKPVFEALPDAKGQGLEKIMADVYHSGETFHASEMPVSLVRNGKQETVYQNFVYEPYRDVDGSIIGIIAITIDVTEQVQARHAIEESEKRLKFILNAVPQQVWTAQPNGMLDYVNDIVCNDFGYNGDEIVGYGWQAFIHPDDLPAYLLTWQKSLNDGTTYQAEFRLKFADGDYRWHLSRAVPLIEDSRITLWLGTNTNIELQKQNEQKKDEFLSIASHELKTPLTSIKAFNQLMRRTQDAAKINGFIDKSTQHISRLEKLINDLLDVTRINAGKMAYDMQPFNFGQMLQDSIESVQLTTPSHEIILERSDALVFTGDRTRLEQVVNNFLTNAIKYSPGGKKVIVNSKVEDNNLIVCIEDFGIGIESQHLQRIFERYYRIDNTAMRFEGLGLGLFISSEILKRHSGSFWIESTPEQGSTFYFRLPLQLPTPVEPVKSDNHYYSDEHITIIYQPEEHRLDADWTGFQDLESVQKGCMQMLAMLAANKASKVLNDNTHVQGTWSEAAEWVGQEWFPMMERAGLQYFAWVYSPSAFSKLSAEKSVDVALGNIATQFFTDTKLAATWLEGK